MENMHCYVKMMNPDGYQDTLTFCYNLWRNKYVFFTFQNFVSDYSAIITDPTAFNNYEKKCQINSVVCEHFLRQGMLEIAEDLINVRI